MNHDPGFKGEERRQTSEAVCMVSWVAEEPREHSAEGDTWGWIRKERGLMILLAEEHPPRAHKALGSNTSTLPKPRMGVCLPASYSANRPH